MSISFRAEWAMINSEDLQTAVKKVIQYELPTPAYLDFVAKYLLQSNPVWKDVDPFAPVLPADYSEVLVPRDEVEHAIMRPGFQVILSKPGSGVASLIARLESGGESLLAESARAVTEGGQPFPKKKPLMVNLPLHRWHFPHPTCNLQTAPGYIACGNCTAGGQNCPLMACLIGAIFGEYWEQFLRPAGKNRDLISRFRGSPAWMHLLSEFYQLYRPQNPKIIDDDYFELMGWLASSNHTPVTLPNWSPDQILSRLVNQLIVAKAPPGLGKQADVSPEAAYDQVYLLANSKSLSDPQIHCLHEVFQYISEREIPRLQFKMFAKTNIQEIVAHLEGVQDGRIVIYTLPAWQESELKTLLAERINIFTVGELPISEVTNDTQYRIPGIQEFIVPSLADQLLPLFAKESMEIAKIDPAGGHDAPFHLLRLFRIFVSICSTRAFPAQQSGAGEKKTNVSSKPNGSEKITEDDLKKLFAEYRRQGQV